MIWPNSGINYARACKNYENIINKNSKFNKHNPFIFVVGYFGEIMKTSSIISSLLFSLQRFIESTKSKRDFLNQFANFNIKLIAFFVVSLSAVTSVPKIFEFEKDPSLNIKNIFIFDSPMPFHITILGSRLSESIPYFLHYILNDFVLLAINLIIDIKLVIQIRKDLKSKVEMQKKLSKNGKIEKD